MPLLALVGDRKQIAVAKEEVGMFIICSGRTNRVIVLPIPPTRLAGLANIMPPENLACRSLNPIATRRFFSTVPAVVKT